MAVSAQAAQALNLSASALSHQLSDLGKLLGQEVLDRRKRPLGLLLLDGDCYCWPNSASQQQTKPYRTLRHSKQDHRRLHAALECHSCFRWLLPHCDAMLSNVTQSMSIFVLMPGLTRCLRSLTALLMWSLLLTSGACQAFTLCRSFSLKWSAYSPVTID